MQHGKSHAKALAPHAFLVFIKVLDLMDVFFKTLVVATGFFKVFRSVFVVIKLL